MIHSAGMHKYLPLANFLPVFRLAARLGRVLVIGKPSKQAAPQAAWFLSSFWIRLWTSTR